MAERTRLVLADDHPIVLAGLRKLIETEPEFNLVGEANAGLAALKLIRDLQPDVAVIDISMPEMNGIVLGRRLAEEAPSVRLIVLTLHEDRAYVKQAMDAGICGYVLKRSAAQNLVHAIRAVVVGGLYLDPAVAHRMLDGHGRRSGRALPPAGAPELTEREAEVLKLIALGFTNKEIARQMHLGVKSVETYKGRGTEKLGFKTRAELVRYAAAQGWLSGL